MVLLPATGTKTGTVSLEGKMLNLPNLSPKTISRFLSGFEMPGQDCWEWEGYRTRSGYGVFSHSSMSGRDMNSHRYSFMFFRGIPPEGYHIHHICKNKACVNPDHLQSVSVKDHPDEPYSINRNKKFCKKGHPYDVENTYFDNRGSRNCKICHRNKSRKAYRDLVLSQGRSLRRITSKYIRLEELVET